MARKLTVGEVKFCEYQRGMTGHFFTNLFKTMEVADIDNLDLLKKAYPTHVQAHLRYSNEDEYWTDLKIRYFEETGGKL